VRRSRDRLRVADEQELLGAGGSQRMNAHSAGMGGAGTRTGGGRGRAVSRILTGWHVCPAITGLHQTAGPKLVAVALKPCLRHATTSGQSRWSAVNTGLRDYGTKAAPTPS
jgi:hypothetical protein